VLGRILSTLPRAEHPDLLVGLTTADDAGVYRISDEVALIQTIDFFTPIVDDPYLYGQIAAANALSDVYAMGGRPLTAMNICGFPDGDLEPEMVAEILRGGQDKVTEAGAVVVGGHTVDDPEPKYGLAVTGVVHPERVLTNATAMPGDRLLLTKRLGTGLMSDAFMDEAVTEADLEPGTESMRSLNRIASEQMVAHGARACTDVTGFGLIGHGLEMAKASGVRIRIDRNSVPHFALSLELAEERQGGGLRRNRAAFEADVTFADSVSEAWRRLLFDPQTSGGLLVAIDAERADGLLEDLLKHGLTAATVGEIVDAAPGTVEVV
jgi:selenide,water dikinase